MILSFGFWGVNPRVLSASLTGAALGLGSWSAVGELACPSSHPVWKCSQPTHPAKAFLALHAPGFISSTQRQDMSPALGEELFCSQGHCYCRIQTECLRDGGRHFSDTAVCWVTGIFPLCFCELGLVLLKIQQIMCNEGLNTKWLCLNQEVASGVLGGLWEVGRWKGGTHRSQELWDSALADYLNMSLTNHALDTTSLQSGQLRHALQKDMGLDLYP